jgi:hypothetical protein
VFALTLAWQQHPAQARRRIAGFGHSGWLLVAYPFLFSLVFLLLMRLKISTSLINLLIFLFSFLLTSPAVLATSFTISAILKAIKISRQRTP